MLMLNRFTDTFYWFYGTFQPTKRMSYCGRLGRRCARVPRWPSRAVTLSTLFIGPLTLHLLSRLRTGYCLEDLSKRNR